MKLLWIVRIWPEPDSSAAGVRTLQLLHACKNAGYEVTVLSPCAANAYEEKLKALGFATVHCPANDARFDEFLDVFQPDIVVFDRFLMEEQFSWRVQKNLPEALRVLDTIDLHALRRIRENARVGDAVAGLCALDAQDDDSMRELASVWRSDLSLLVSDAEEKLLTTQARVNPEFLHVCRFSCLPYVPASGESAPDFASRKHFLFMGNGHHAPNLDAIEFLAKTLWPSLREMLAHKGSGDAELHIYGAYLPQKILALHNERSGFLVKGKAAHAQECFAQYRVSLAPLRFGAGIKGKILDSWAAGTPCVTTSLGAEGMHGEHVFPGRAEDNWENFCKEACALYSQEKSWSECQSAGYALLHELYDLRKIEESFLESIKEALAKRDERRGKNFFGQILWYKQFRATEYFSRWIEGKNKQNLSS